ncbi:hypothetical protein EH220_02615, partial [bacterium]
MKNYQIRTAFILGAGLGKRLRPLTENLPKPLLPVGGRPIITYAMDHCRTVGVERFIVNTHHCAEAYDRAFPGGSRQGMPILFRHEPVLLDTAGGLKNIEDLLEENETLLVYNGDILSDLPLSRLVTAHAAGGYEVTLVLRSDGPIRNVCLDAKGAICDIRDLVGNPGVRRCQFTGIFIAEKRFFRRLTAGKIESVVPVFVEMIRETQGSVGSVVIDDGQWLDIGDTETYMRIADAVPLRYEEKNAEQDPLPFIRETLGLAAETPVETRPVGKGGSDRAYFRVAITGAPSAVLMRYGRMYEENDHYVSIAFFLKEIGVTVPQIYGHDPERRLILMDDLGDMDLYALRDASWEVRRTLYEKTLALAAKLHAFPLDRLPVGLRLMPGFDASLYQWERNYFIEECVRNACRIELDPAESEALEKELSGLAERLMETPYVLIHRDLQSQNIMIREGEPILVDFQGLRFGSLFYDLGSLLCDPYVIFPEEGREELLRFYHGISSAGYSWDTFRELFLLASAQRLMQALGAYGFLGLKRGKPHFLAHIRPALDNLISVTAETDILPRLHAIA